MMPEPDTAQQAFDAAAPVYDSMYEVLPGIRRIRRTTSALYLQYFPRAGSLLEINCGTGIDAVFLAERTMNVLATDASPRMIDEVRKKVAERGLEASVEPRRLAFSELGSLRGKVFDGAYSNLGGLNCTDRLESVAADLWGLVKPGGFFIATVMPSFCLWETVAFATRFRWRDAFRRASGEGTLASLHGGRVRTYYHSPRTFSAAFAEYFEPVKTVGLAVLLPPPNFERAYALLGRSLHALETVDEAVAGLPFIRSIGDHYVMVLRRKPR